MGEKPIFEEEDDFDRSDDTSDHVHRGITASEADLALLREAIHQHGQMMGEVNKKLQDQAEELIILQGRCRRNAHNIKVLAKRLGLRVDGGASEVRPETALTAVEPEDEPEDQGENP